MTVYKNISIYIPLNMEGTRTTEIEDFMGNVIPFKLQNNMKTLYRIIEEMLKLKINDRETMNEFIKTCKQKYQITVGNAELLYAYRKYILEKDIKYDKNIELALQASSQRSKSGVQVFTIVTSPYPDGYEFSCEWNCKYCPLQPGQPRSYLKEEPGVSRANRYNFDPTMQFRDRGFSYFVNGHPVDKCEVIILGGTWHSYPKNYRDKFITSIYYAANTFFDNVDVKKLREMKSLDEEKKINETTLCRIIGITIETRPDCIKPNELIVLREYGVTRIQMGVQHINDRMLERVDRRCNSKQAINAIKLLKDNCFKVDIHIMPDLPKPLKIGVDFKKKVITNEDIDWDFDVYKSDEEMFDILINDADWQTDQWKIYPFEVVPYTELKDEYDRGLHKSYGEVLIDNPFGHIGKKSKNSNKFSRLHELLMKVKSEVKPYVRLNRIVRDIPTQYIMGGTTDVSMRQILQIEMKKRGLKCKCIRCKEIKDKKIDHDTAVLFVREYHASDGIEYFISFETPDENTLFGFCRLRISKNTGRDLKSNIIFGDLVDMGLIRELHVYGQTVSVSDKNAKQKQHMGFGLRLLEEANKIAKNKGCKGTAVIAGVGVKKYYERKANYKFGEYFMVKYFDEKKCNYDKKYRILSYLLIVIGVIMLLVKLLFMYYMHL